MRIHRHVDTILKRRKTGMSYNLVDYFQPMQKQEPTDESPWIPMVNVATPGFLELSPEEQEQAIMEFEEQAATKKDWFYGVLKDETGHPRVFIAQNETGAFTAMLNSEY